MDTSIRMWYTNNIDTCTTAPPRQEEVFIKKPNLSLTLFWECFSLLQATKGKSVSESTTTRDIEGNLIWHVERSAILKMSASLWCPRHGAPWPPSLLCGGRLSGLSGLWVNWGLRIWDQSGIYCVKAPPRELGCDITGPSNLVCLWERLFLTRQPLLVHARLTRRGSSQLVRVSRDRTHAIDDILQRNICLRILLLQFQLHFPQLIWVQED